MDYDLVMDNYELWLLEWIDFFPGGKQGARPTWKYFNEKFIQHILTELDLHMFYYIGAQKRSYEAKFPLIFPPTFMNILDQILCRWKGYAWPYLLKVRKPIIMSSV